MFTFSVPLLKCLITNALNAFLLLHKATANPLSFTFMFDCASLPSVAHHKTIGTAGQKLLKVPFKLQYAGEVCVWLRSVRSQQREGTGCSGREVPVK